MGPGVAIAAVGSYPNGPTVRAGRRLEVGALRSRQHGAFHVHGVELAVAAVVGIELELADAAAVSGIVIEAVEDSRAIAAAVEVEVGRQRLRFPVEDVDRPVHVGHEHSSGAARFLANRVDAREHAVDLPRAVDVPGNGQGREVPQFERQRCRALGRRGDDGCRRGENDGRDDEAHATCLRRSLPPAESCRRSCCRYKARRCRPSRAANPRVPGWPLSAATEGVLPALRADGRRAR